MNFLYAQPSIRLLDYCVWTVIVSMVLGGQYMMWRSHFYMRVLERTYVRLTGDDLCVVNNTPRPRVRLAVNIVMGLFGLVFYAWTVYS